MVHTHTHKQHKHKTKRQRENERPSVQPDGRVQQVMFIAIGSSIKMKLEIAMHVNRIERREFVNQRNVRSLYMYFIALTTRRITTRTVQLLLFLYFWVFEQ